MEEQQNGMAHLGEISTIRNILMGQQMSEYNTQFQQVEERINQLEDSFTSQLEELRLQTEAERQRMETNTNERFDQLEKLISEQMQRLNAKLEAVSKEDKERLGEWLGEVSRRLIEG